MTEDKLEELVGVVSLSLKERAILLFHFDLPHDETLIDLDKIPKLALLLRTLDKVPKLVQFLRDQF